MADGYIKLYGKLKSVTEEGKVADYSEIDGVPIIMQDLNASGFTPTANTYYLHTGTTQAQFTQGVIYFYNGTNYIALGNDEFVPKKTTTGTYVYTHNGETQGEMEVKSSITPSDNEIPTSNGVINMVNILIADKQDKIITFIATYSGSTPDYVIILLNNKRIVFDGVVASIDINLPTGNIPLDFMCELVIGSGGISAISYPTGIEWSGTDVTYDGTKTVFTPTATKPYNILFFNNGASQSTPQWQAIVRGATR